MSGKSVADRGDVRAAPPERVHAFWIVPESCSHTVVLRRPQSGRWRAELVSTSAAVHYHFGNKLLLFGAVAQVSVEREPLVESLRVTPVGELGITLTSLVLRLWDFDLRTVFLATLRSQATAANFDTAWSQLREALIGEVARRVDQPPGTGLVRAELAAAQLLGAVMARHDLGARICRINQCGVGRSGCGTLACSTI